MPSDWIKMRTDLYRDPKVSMIAGILAEGTSELTSSVKQSTQRDFNVTRNVMRNAVVGALVSVWGVLRHRGKRIDDDLIINSCSISVIDDVADIPGFGDAMMFVGWVHEGKNGIVLPRFFEEFNIDPAENQAEKNRERQRRFREKQREENNALRNVTVTLNSNAREEKRREELTTSVSREKIAFNGTEFQNINGQLSVWKGAYPAIDVEAEIKKAAAWVVANPKNIKKQWGRFINGWLSRAQDKAPRVQSKTQTRVRNGRTETFKEGIGWVA